MAFKFYDLIYFYQYLQNIQNLYLLKYRPSKVNFQLEKFCH